MLGAGANQTQLLAQHKRNSFAMFLKGKLFQSHMRERGEEKNRKTETEQSVSHRLDTTERPLIKNSKLEPKSVSQTILISSTFTRNSL